MVKSKLSCLMTIKLVEWKTLKMGAFTHICRKSYNDCPLYAKQLSSQNEVWLKLMSQRQFYC